MSNWVIEELQAADFGDKRLTDRFCNMVSEFSEHPEKSVPAVFDAKKDVKAAYSFWGSDKVDPSGIIAPHIMKTAERAAAYDCVICIQDTTQLNYTHHPATEGLGYLEKGFMRGFFLHNALCVTETGVTLGLLHQKYWTRPLDEYGKGKKRMQKPIEEKESYRWIETLQATAALIPPTTRMITICDREADIYEMYAADRPNHCDLLIRAAQNRRIEDECKYLSSAIEAAPVLGYRTVRIPRKDKQPERQARLEIRATSVELKPPQCKPGKNSRPNIPVQVVLAQEVDAPDGVKPVRWVLTTTLSVESFEDAIRIVEYYTLRWLVERFHYTLKSGCKVEDLQLKHGDNLQNAVATYSIVAWRLMWAMYLSRKAPDTPATEVLTQDEVDVLYAHKHKKSRPEATIVTIREAMRWIAKLGGFLGRKGDGDPGIKTIWRGWMRLADMNHTWKLAKNIQSCPKLMGKD